jgi:hypothetical protein
MRFNQLSKNKSIVKILFDIAGLFDKLVIKGKLILV